MKSSSNQEDEGNKASRAKESGEILPSSPKCSTEPLFSSSFGLHQGDEDQNETKAASSNETTVDQHFAAVNMGDSSRTDAIPRKKRKFEEASSGLVVHHEASGWSSSSGAMHQQQASSEEVAGPPSASEVGALGSEEEEAEEAGLSLLFAASLMQQNEDNEDENDEDDVDPSGLLFDQHPMMSNTTSSTSLAFPLLSSDIATAPRSTAVASLPIAPRQPQPMPQTSVSPVPIAAAGTPPASRAGDTITEPTEYDGA